MQVWVMELTAKTRRCHGRPWWDCWMGWCQLDILWREIVFLTGSVVLPWVATPLKEVLTKILAGHVGSVCHCLAHEFGSMLCHFSRFTSASFRFHVFSWQRCFAATADLTKWQRRCARLTRLQQRITFPPPWSPSRLRMRPTNFRWKRWVRPKNNQLRRGLNIWSDSLMGTDVWQWRCKLGKLHWGSLRTWTPWRYFCISGRALVAELSLNANGLVRKKLACVGVLLVPTCDMQQHWWDKCHQWNRPNFSSQPERLQRHGMQSF